jgi:Zn-dependent peptidase ImmA (M78 family)/transcriptional regulator with XRE-family HTH domain
MKTSQPKQSNDLGIRLRAARKMAGLSMEDLAQRLGGIVTKQSIGKYENGLMKPSPDVLAALSKALNIPLPSFSPLPRISPRPSPTSVDDSYEIIRGKSRAAAPTRAPFNDGIVNYCSVAPSPTGSLNRSISLDRPTARAVPSDPESDLKLVEFRSRPHMPAKLASSLKHRIADSMRKLIDLENLLASPAEFRATLPKPVLSTPDDAERAALTIRGDWDLGSSPIVNLLDRLESAGIGVLEIQADESFDGLSASFNHRPVIAVNTSLPTDRVRFTAAHELGHIMHQFSSPESMESLCQHFAGAFLLPRSVIEDALKPAPRKLTLWELKEIKESYGISFQAVMYRAHSLGLITDRQWRHFRETLKAKGWDKTEPVAYRGREAAVRFKQLLNYAVAQNILDLDSAAGLLGVSPAALEKEIGNVF